jgi:spermidine/putrescine-binding protein
MMMSRMTKLPDLGLPTRRHLLGGAGATVLTMAGLSVPFGRGGQARAEPGVIRAYGTTTAALRDWTPFTKATGLRMEYTPHNGEIASYMREIVANEIGRKTDIYFFEGGPQNQLGPQGYYLPINEKHPALTLWERTSDAYKRSSLMQDSKGIQYGVPIMNNADSFGFWPEAVGVADPKATLSWALIFESDKTRGRVALDNQYDITIPETANWLQISGRDKFGDTTNPTPEEAKRIADYLISRKKAGQFRTFFANYDEQVQLLRTREVDILNCWEPVVKDVNRAAGKQVVFYAFAEFYNKWGQGLFIAAPEKDPETVNNIYKTANYFLGGEYGAYRARDRGYGGPNMDLAIKYATDAGWSKEDIAAIQAVQVKVDRKYQAKRSWYRRLPDHRDVMEEEYQRFLSA